MTFHNMNALPVNQVGLNVQGAFPNTVQDRLLHNMKLRGIPEGYILLIDRMLTDRRTRLKFDDYFSDRFC